MTVLAVNHPLYVKTVANLERTAVRDKLLRLVQYFARFLSFVSFRKGYSMAFVKQLRSLTSALSLARKAFRAGKPLAAFRAVAQEVSNHTSDPVVHATTIGKNLGIGLYLVLDTVMFLTSSGSLKVSKTTSTRIQTHANRFWLLSIVSGLTDALYRSYVSNAKINALNSDEKATSDEKKLAKLEFKKQLRLVAWNALDMLIPLHALNILPTNDGIVGAAGTITSYLGLKDLW